MTCIETSCRMNAHSVNRRTPAATGSPVAPLSGEQFDVKRCGRGPHPPRRRRFDVLAPAHPVLLIAHLRCGVVDHLAHALVPPDRAAEELEIAVAHADYVTAQHRYRTRRAPLSSVVGIFDERRQIRQCDSGVQPHGYGGIILIPLNGIRDAHGDHPGHHFAEAQTRTGQLAASRELPRRSASRPVPCSRRQFASITMACSIRRG